MRLGSKMSDESRHRLSIAKTGTRQTDETRLKRSLTMRGRPSPRRGTRLSDETRRRMSVARRGKPRSPQHLAKMRATYLKKYGDNIEGAVYGRRKRLRKLKLLNLTHTLGEWETLKAQYGFTCPSCQRSEPAITLTKDHVIPLRRGGSDLIENLQPLCHSCNSKKHMKVIRF